MLQFQLHSLNRPYKPLIHSLMKEKQNIFSPDRRVSSLLSDTSLPVPHDLGLALLTLHHHYARACKRSTYMQLSLSTISFIFPTLATSLHPSLSALPSHSSSALWIVSITFLIKIKYFTNLCVKPHKS